MKTITKSDMENRLWEHQRGGGGWAIIHTLPSPYQEYCRVITVGKDKLDKQAFLAWSGMLSPGKRFIDPKEPLLGTCDAMIPEGIKPALDELRTNLKNGTVKIVSSHIVKA